MDKSLFRLAHLSDLHFSKLTWNPSQFFSKRWLGNLNLALARKHTLDPGNLTTLLPVFHERKVDAVLITGDLSSTAHKKEFALAREFIDHLKNEQFKVFTLPGNHDHYTKAACRSKLFYQFFDATYGEPSDLSLRDDRLTRTFLGHGWWLIALDTALATSLLSSNGLFAFETEQKLIQVLKEIPEGHQVILLNHFPLFANDSKRKSLIRREALSSLLERFPNIRLFLHGHSHRHCIADLRSSNLPIILDSGSTSLKKGGTWNLIDITSQGCEIEVFKNGVVAWETVQKQQFKW